jgi:hypothetical protein
MSSRCQIGVNLNENSTIEVESRYLQTSDDSNKANQH